MSGADQGEERFHSLPGSAARMEPPSGSRNTPSGFNTPERSSLRELQERSTFHPVSTIKNMIQSFRRAGTIPAPSVADDSEPIDTSDLMRALDDAVGQLDHNARKVRELRERKAWLTSRNAPDSDSSGDDEPEAHINMMSSGGGSRSR